MGQTMTPDFYDMDRIREIRREARDSEMLADGGNTTESFECFSELPLDFEEMTAGMRNDLEEVYALTGTLGRFSKDYPAVCRTLERMIRYLGRCCVTKAVLEQKGMEFPMLQGLELKDLYCMVSFNFRKTRTAFHEGKRLKNCLDMGLLDLECRWVDLAERLKATEEKIRLIRDGKLNADRILERARMFKGEKSARRTDGKSARALAEKARALPVIGSVARQLLAEKKAAEAVPAAVRKTFGDIRPFEPVKVFPPDVIENTPAVPEPGSAGTDPDVSLIGMTREEFDRMTREAWERMTGIPAPAESGGPLPVRA